MQATEDLTTVLERVFKRTWELIEEEVRRFADDLEGWLANLFARLPDADWRGELRDFVELWRRQNIAIAPQSVRALEELIAREEQDSIVRQRQLVAAQADQASAASPLETAPLLYPALMRTETEDYDPLALPPPGPPLRERTVKKVVTITSWLDDYDALVASGERTPSAAEAAAVAVYRMWFPPSEPTIVVYYDNGDVEINPGGGPSSGDMAMQATAILTAARAALVGGTLKGAAVAIGKEAVRESIETGVDAAFQQETGLPVGPSALKSLKSRGRIGKTEWLQRVDEANAFNKLHAPGYPHNEVYVEKAELKGYYRLDSYNSETGEIVSRKLTQFAEIQESTGIRYIRELPQKYSPGAIIAGVPSSGGLAGEQLRGQMILEVPVQAKAIPQSVIDAANKSRVIIRDVTGRVYN